MGSGSTGSAILQLDAYIPELDAATQDINGDAGPQNGSLEGTTVLGADELALKAGFVNEYGEGGEALYFALIR